MLWIYLQQSKEINWLTDIDAALTKAKQEDKYVMVYFYGVKQYNYACQRMESEVFGNEQVIDFVNRYFVCVKIDMEEPKGLEIFHKYRLTAVPTTVLLRSDGSVVVKIAGAYYTPETFITASKSAIGLIKAPLSIENALDQTQMLLSIPESMTGWVRPDLYLSPVYKIKPGQIIKDICVYEKASPNDLATARLLIRSCEKAGAIKYWVNREYQGLSFVDEAVARGEVVASCCAMPWTEAPLLENVQEVVSEDYAGEFQFVMIILIEHEN
jgi:thiol-disulfide isomerase/thioredoxin